MRLTQNFYFGLRAATNPSRYLTRVINVESLGGGKCATAEGLPQRWWVGWAASIIGQRKQPAGDSFIFQLIRIVIDDLRLA